MDQVSSKEVLKKIVAERTHTQNQKKTGKILQIYNNERALGKLNIQ